MDKQPCARCEKMFNRNELTWVTDSYNIPYKKVCDECYEKTEEEIRDWRLDEGYAGERLEPDPDVFGRGFDW
jgi:hypothetical protein